MLSAIKHFYNQIQSDIEGHRYRSWEHCYKAFGNNELSIDEKSLHLAFYLASWGMYRGSSGLLWKDYTIHRQTVVIAEKYESLRIRDNVYFPEVNVLKKCIKEISSYYSGIQYHNGKETKYITATDTLVTKIMLGIFGVIPAFDRYFRDGIKQVLHVNSFSLNELDSLFSYGRNNMPEIEACQQYILDQSGFWYPPMKILDMYFWQIGFELDNPN